LIIGNVTGGNISQHTHLAPEKFKGVFELTNLPQFLGGVWTIDLDGVATLRLCAPYSMSHATLAVDMVPMRAPDSISESVQIRDAFVTTGKRQELYFDNEHNKRHTLEAGGKVFIVSLRETEQLQVEGVANPLKFVFAVKEA
jgi:hypothetical protein